MQKRYYLTLTKENVEAIHSHLAALRLPKSTMSGLVDEWLQKFEPTLRRMVEKKQRGEQLTFEEVMGDLISELAETVREAGRP